MKHSIISIILTICCGIAVASAAQDNNALWNEANTAYYLSMNMDGVLYAESYGQVTSVALDPVEKKPLRHFNPGKTVLSVGSYGCNLVCPFCQNCLAWSLLKRRMQGEVGATRNGGAVRGHS